MANYQAGFNAKGRINTAVYTFATYRARDTAQDQNVSNTEGIPGNPSFPAGVNGTIATNNDSRITSQSHMEADVTNATFDTLANPFGAPTGPNTPIGGAVVKSGQYIALRIYPAGIGSVSWWSPSFMVLTNSQDGDVKALQPVSFSGMSDGWYQTPYQ